MNKQQNKVPWRRKLAGLSGNCEQLLPWPRTGKLQETESLPGEEPVPATRHSVHTWFINIELARIIY